MFRFSKISFLSFIPLICKVKSNEKDKAKKVYIKKELIKLHTEAAEPRDNAGQMGLNADLI